MIQFNDDMASRFDQVIGSLAINMRARAEKTSITLDEFVTLSRANGIDDSITRQILTKDLNEGGRIFGEFFNGLGFDISGRLGELSRSASRLRMGFTNKAVISWVSVSIQEGNKACPDCDSRHGETDTFENWVLRGLPKTGWSVCRANCKCVLMKESDVIGEESLLSPVRVNKGE